MPAVKFLKTYKKLVFFEEIDEFFWKKIEFFQNRYSWQFSVKRKNCTLQEKQLCFYKKYQSQRL